MDNMFIQACWNEYSACTAINNQIMKCRQHVFFHCYGFHMQSEHSITSSFQSLSSLVMHRCFHWGDANKGARAPIQHKAAEMVKTAWITANRNFCPEFDNCKFRAAVDSNQRRQLSAKQSSVFSELMKSLTSRVTSKQQQQKYKSNYRTHKCVHGSHTFSYWIFLLLQQLT